MTAQELINERQQLFEAVKTKAMKCTDRTQLCAAIYPWVSHLVREYANTPTTQYSVDSFRKEIYDFHQALSVHLLAIPRVVSSPPASNAYGTRLCGRLWRWQLVSQT